MGGLPWWDVVKPHKDVLDNTVSAASFAADLQDVVSGHGSKDYSDAKQFFRRTFMTGQLRALLADTLQRLAGLGGVEPVVQLATPFGGGKTHSLLSIYHLLHSGSTVLEDPGVLAVLQQAKLSEIPSAKIAVLVGTALNVQGRKSPGGINIRTLWGEVAFQLGGVGLYEDIREDDERLTSPGDDKLKRMLRKAGPSVILLDETLPYVEKAATIKVGESTLARQTTVFIQELQQAVTAVGRCVFFYTLPGSETEQYGEKAQQAYQTLKQLAQVAGRLETVRVPVQGDDIFEVVRRRLFDNQGTPVDIKRAAEDYLENYDRMRGELPGEVFTPEFKTRLMKAFPFHPRTIDLFYQRWGTLPGFQRTRGVLQLLAQAVSLLYSQGQASKLHPSALIMPGDLPLDDPTFRGNLTKYTGSEFETVISVDIVGGPDSKAAQIDKELGSEFQKARYGQGLATTIFLYSFGGGNTLTQGVNEAELRLAVTRPDSQPIFGEVLSRFERRMWYLYKDAGLYHFRSAANLNKVISETEENIGSQEVTDLVKDQVFKALNKDKDVFASIHPFPGETRDVPDTADLRLVVLPPQNTLNGAQDQGTQGEDSQNRATRRVLADFNEKSGLLSRSNKNSLVFLVADASNLASALRTARQLLALRQVDTRLGSSDQLSKVQRADLTERKKRAEEDFPRSAQQAYRHVVVFVENMNLREFDLGTDVISGGSLAAKVASRLKSAYLLLDRIDLGQQFDRWTLWPSDQVALNLKTLVGYYSQYTYLPRLTNPQAVLKAAIIQAVKDGKYGLLAGNSAETPQRIFREEDTSVAFQNYPVDSLWLVTQAKALELKPPAPTVPVGGPEVNPDGNSSREGTNRRTDNDEGSGPKPAQPRDPGQIAADPPPVSRHSYRVARFDLSISTDRFAEQVNVILDVIDVLKTSATSIDLSVSISSQNGKLDNYEETKELLTQHSIKFQGKLE